MRTATHRSDCCLTKFNIGVRNKDGNIDIPRMREGGLDAKFFSIWVPTSFAVPGTVVSRTASGLANTQSAVSHVIPPI
jgi:hypothetical protein